MSLSSIQAHIRDIPDFPKPGIVFKDITPLLAAPAAFSACIDLLAQRMEGLNVDGILAVESRGFIFGAPLAHSTGVPLQLVRKHGKLPGETVSVRYELEYGFDQLEVNVDAIRPGGRYLVLDDLIATGGTAAATAKLVVQEGGTVAACLFVIELGFLNGRAALADFKVDSLVKY